MPDYIWIIISVFAALMQTVRTGLQKHLRSELPTLAVTWVRYGFGLPFVLLYVAVLALTGVVLPAPTFTFFGYCVLGGVAQIVATALLVGLFSHRGFAIGTIYTKTEALLAAVFGVVFFGAYLSFGGLVAITLGVVGVVCISFVEDKFSVGSVLRNLISKASLMGVGAGACFALSAVLIRQASLALPHSSQVAGAAMTLLVMVSLQAVLLGGWLCVSQQTVFKQVRLHWRQCTAVGLTSMLGSAGWFTALAMAYAAYVKTVGQVEVIFMLVAAHKLFNERLRAIEWLGVILITASILVLLLS